ncbi:hypothetical protein IW138_005930 [Coemansia sp. RSA 986]|nr:hypothetical protein IW138_005930 [Coemansia sp. RSA 986]
MSTEPIINTITSHESEIDFIKEIDTINSSARSSVGSSFNILNNSIDVKGKCSSFSTFINIICVAVGVGSLQLAYTLNQSGWFGTVFIIFAAALSFVTAALTIKCIYLKPVLMIATSAIMCVPTLFAKTLGETLIVSLIGTATSAIVTVVVIAMASIYPIRNGEIHVGDTVLHKGNISHSGVIPGGFAMALTSASFAYINTTIVPHLEGGMRRPQMFNRVFLSSLAVIVAIYLAMATTGYAAYGDKTKSPVTLNFPDRKCIDC